MQKFGRLLTAIVTPFDAEGKVDYTQARKLAKALIDSGSDGIVVSGSTGESPTLKREEKLRLFSEIKSAVGDKGSVIASTGSYSTSNTVELTVEAGKTGVDGFLIVVPYYNKPTQDGLYRHFKVIAEATKLPCILYNVPSRTVTNMAAETTIKLSQISNIVGIKEASTNFDLITKIINGTGKDFLVYSGNDSDILPIMALGGYGVISVISHLVGKQIKALIEHFLCGQLTEAALAHAKLLPLINTLFVVANPMPIKYALNYLGFPVGQPRLPLTELEEETKELVQNTLRHYQIDLPVRGQP